MRQKNVKCNVSPLGLVVRVQTANDMQVRRIEQVRAAGDAAEPDVAACHAAAARCLQAALATR